MRTTAPADAAPASAVDPGRRPCERCGAPARVQVLRGYVRGQPVRQRLCFPCADAAFRAGLEAPLGGPRPRLSAAAVLVVAGLLLTLLGIFFDELHVRGSRGFGWLQRTSALLAAVLFLLGTLLRIDVVTVVGAVVLALTLSADVLGIVGQPGIGWRQTLMIVAGLILLLAALRCQRAGARPGRSD